MNNLKKSIMSVAMAAITAASPILSSYAAYASDITVNDDGTVTQISTSTEGSTSKADETKFLFIKIKTAGGKVVLNEGEDQEQRIRLDKKTDGVEYIDVYDKNDVLISSESTKDNGYTYVYEAKADDAVSVKAKADEGYKVKLYELTDDSSGAEIAEDVGFDAGNKVDSFKYPVFMEYDKTVKIGFEKTESADDIAKDLSVNDKTGKDKADEQSKAEADVESEDKTSKKDEAESKETEDAKADGSDEKHDDANVDEASNDEDLTVDTAGDADTSDTVGDESKEESEAVNSSENSDTETEAENKNEDLTIDSKEEINADDAEADAENTDADSVKGDADIANADADAEAKEEEENVEESVEDSDIEEPDVNADETTKSGEHFTEISTEISSLDADLFSSARLVIMTGDANNIVDAEHIIANYDNIYLMQYSTVEQAMTAYLYYNYTASTGVIDAVEPDAPLEAADEKTVEGTAPIDETNVQVTADANPISSIEETKPAETKEATNVIALIDTGVSESANVIDRVSLIGDELEGNGHGDRMLQAIVGQNADASVLSIRTMGNDGRGTVSSIIAGMEYALQQNVKIINLSLSAKTNLSNSVLKAEIEKAVNAGVEVVAAAGNDNANVKDYMPGSVEAATVIGAADENGERMIGSNYGDTVDYNVVAGTTSEAAAKFSGFLTTGIDIMGVVNTDGLIYQPDYVAAETTVTPEVTKAPDEDLPDDEEDDEWTIGDYPSANSTVSKEEDVWYKDTAYEFDKYNPYGDDVIVKCETEGKTASFKIGDTVEFQYKYALKENPEYAWDLYCTFNFIDDRDLVTTKSDSVDKIFPDIVCQERNEGYRGVVPERTGETVTGKTFNILANTKNFELGGLLQDYNPETFKINSIDENGFDITKPGEYKVTFEMSYFMYAKHNDSGEKLGGAIYRVQYSEYGENQFKSRRTWYLKTDEEGVLKFDEDHYLTSWKDSNGAIHKSGALVHQTNGKCALPIGFIRVREMEAPEGYGLDPKEYEVRIQAEAMDTTPCFLSYKTHEFLMPAQKDENGYYSIKELTATPIKVVEPPLGKIWCAQVKLKKVDENGKGLKGAKFYIWDNEKCTGDPIGQLESGDNGESNIVQIDDIPWDNETYTVYCQEYEAPTNYVTIDDKFSVTFKRSDYEALYKADKNTKGKIEYFGPKTGIPNDKGWTVRMNAKKVNMNQDGLADAEFTIYKIVGSDKKEVGKIVSGDDGMTNELSVGIDNKETTAKFLCVETKAPNGHAISEESKTGYTLEFQKSTYDELYKADKDTKGELKTFGPTTGIPNPTVTITQPITPPITPPTTGTGLNVIKTSKAPDDVMELNSYTLEGAVFRVTSSRDGDMGTITTDASGYAGPLTLPDNSTKTWVDPATDKEGHVTRPGYWQINEVITTYYITEETPPKGHYKNNSTKSISVTMPRDAKQTFEVTFEDVPKFNKASSFDIEKLGVKGEPIEGVVFKVEYFDGDDDSDNPVRTWHIKTDSNGHARLGNSYLDANRQNDPFYMYEGNIVIPIGGYLKVTEVAAPAEYVLDDTPMGAKTVEGQDIKFTYANGNAWYNELQRCRVDLQKYEADGTTPIPGVEFEIEFLEAAIQPTSKKHPNFKRLLNVGEKTVRHTDTDGKVFFDNLDQGTYKITEIKTKDGNALLKEPIVFTLPFKMTNQEASEYGNVDFTTAKEDVGYSGKWYFYNCKYDITNNATFSMPMTGDDGKWKYGFIGLGMAAALASVWLVYETRNKKFRKRKHKK